MVSLNNQAWTLDWQSVADHWQPLVVALLLIGAGIGISTVPVAAHSAATSADEPSFLVQLQPDGDARVTLTLTYDLGSDDERLAFRTLENDSEARADARERFRTRMASVAADTSAATGRDMSITDPTIDVRMSDDGSVGVVELAVTWTNLAATQDGKLVVTEPFASGFEPQQPFTIKGPDGYRLDQASPSPDSSTENAATWQPGSDLSGFEVVFVATEATAPNGGKTGISVPGFGLGVALLALLGTGIAIATRRP